MDSKREVKKLSEEISFQIKLINGSLNEIKNNVENYDSDIIKNYEKKIYNLTTRLDIINNKLLDKDLEINNLHKQNKILRQKLENQEKQHSEKIKILEHLHDKKINEIIKDYSEKEISLSSKLELMQKDTDSYKRKLYAMHMGKKQLLSKIQKELEQE